MAVVGPAILAVDDPDLPFLHKVISGDFCTSAVIPDVPDGDDRILVQHQALRPSAEMRLIVGLTPQLPAQLGFQPGGRGVDKLCQRRIPLGVFFVRRDTEKALEPVQCSQGIGLQCHSLGHNAHPFCSGSGFSGFGGAVFFSLPGESFLFIAGPGCLGGLKILAMLSPPHRRYQRRQLPARDT